MADTDTDITDAPAKVGRTKPRKPRPPEWKIRKNFLEGNHPVVKRFPTESAARGYIKKNHPRGREVFLENPDGSCEHYSADLAAQEEDPWIEFSEDEEE